MPSSARCDSHLLLEYGGPLLQRGDRCQVNSTSASLMNNRRAMRGLDILNPIGFRAKH